MKISKTLLVGLMVVGFAGAASASVTTLCIAGSTAFRGSVIKAIQDSLAPGYTYAFDGTGTQTQFNAGQATYSGSIKTGLTGAGESIIVKTYWTGSVAGVCDVSTTNPIIGFIPTSALPSTGGSNVHGLYTKESNVPNVAMSDASAAADAESVATAAFGSIDGSVYQADITNAGLVDAGSTGTNKAGTAKTVGMLPFVWVAGAETSGSTPPYTNMTQQAASTLESQGYIPASMLSGTAFTTSTNDFVFLIGRNEDSGTRVNAQAEAAIGVTTAVSSFGLSMNQYYAVFTANNGSVATSGSFPSDDVYAQSNAGLGITAGSPIGNIETGGTNCTLVDIGLWPADAPVNTETSINWDTEGHSGQAGGSGVAGVLDAVNPVVGLNLTLIDNGGGKPTSPIAWNHSVSKAYLVGYLGTADAGGIPSTAGCTYLTFNGVPYSPANVYNGSYSFWGFEHMYYRGTGTNSPTGAQLDMTTDIADTIFSTDAPTDSSGNTDTAIPPTNVKVGGLIFNSTVTNFTRGSEGLPVTLN